MEMIVPTDTCFDCPQGAHHATFYQQKEVAKYTKRGEEKFVRLLFQPDQLSKDDTLVLVGRNFVPSLKRGSDLRMFLDTWLGDDFVDQHKQGGKFNFRRLERQARRYRGETH